MTVRPKLSHAGCDYLCLMMDDMPSEIGRLFAEMGSDEQAQFWDAVAAATKRWDRAACFQWRDMADYLTPAARSLIDDMHDNTTNSNQ